MDIMLVSITKIVMLIKITQQTNYNFQQPQMITHHRNNDRFNDDPKISYKIQLWDVKHSSGGKSELKTLFTFKINN